MVNGKKNRDYEVELVDNVVYWFQKVSMHLGQPSAEKTAINAILGEGHPSHNLDVICFQGHPTYGVLSTLVRVLFPSFARGRVLPFFFAFFLSFFSFLSGKTPT